MKTLLCKNDFKIFYLHNEEGKIFGNHNSNGLLAVSDACVNVAAQNAKILLVGPLHEKVKKGVLLEIGKSSVKLKVLAHAYFLNKMFLAWKDL